MRSAPGWTPGGGRAARLDHQALGERLDGARVPEECRAELSSVLPNEPRLERAVHREPGPREECCAPRGQRRHAAETDRAARGPAALPVDQVAEDGGPRHGRLAEESEEREAAERVVVDVLVERHREDDRVALRAAERLDERAA